ncbi:MAG TPA: hypothetical protein VMA37_12540 [Acetobacteraceae bacterium]|nr:hypothetical protein [Acetobacteraceae bacterium]
MVRKFVLASILCAGTAVAAVPAHAWYGGPYYRPPCCYGGAVAAGAVAGLAVGTAIGVAAASHPAYVVPPPVVYAPAPPVVYAPPPVVYPPPHVVYVPPPVVYVPAY